MQCDAARQTQITWSGRGLCCLGCSLIQTSLQWILFGDASIDMINLYRCRCIWSVGVSWAKIVCRICGPRFQVAVS